MEDPLDCVLRAELSATAAPGGAQGRNAREGEDGEVEKFPDKIRGEGGGEASEGSQGRGNRHVDCLIRVYVY